MAIDSDAAEQAGAARIRGARGLARPAGLGGGGPMDPDRRRTRSPRTSRAPIQLLEDAGYVDSDGDGIREMPAGLAGPGTAARVPLLRADRRADLGRRRPVRFGVAPGDRDQDGGHGGELGQAHRHHQRRRVRAVLVGLVPGPRPGVDPVLLHVRPATAGRHARTATTTPTTAIPSTTSCTRNSSRQTDANARWDIVHQMQKMFYEDSPYAIMWYDPCFSAWRSDRFEGYIPQPQPNGDPLEGWGGISEVWLSLTTGGRGRGAAQRPRASRRWSGRSWPGSSSCWWRCS